MGSESDIVGAAIYLSTNLSSWVTGQNIIVDGGFGKISKLFLFLIINFIK